MAVERLPIDELEGTVDVPRPNLAHRLGGLLTRPLESLDTITTSAIAPVRHCRAHTS